MSDESYESNYKEFDKFGSESGSAGTFGTGLGGFLSGVGFVLGVISYANESCDGDGVPLALS